MPGRGSALLLFFFRLRLRRLASAGSESTCAQGIRRIPGDGRTRLWLGKSYVRDFLPGVLGGARPKTFIARFHNVYGPYGTWDGGREKAPAAICRTVFEAIDTGSGQIQIWGDGAFDNLIWPTFDHFIWPTPV